MKECPVDILQYHWEFDILLDLYKRIKPKVVLEIGSLYGGTIYHWLTEADWPVTVLSVDLFDTTDFEETKKLWHSWLKQGQSVSAMKADSHSDGTIGLITNSVKDITGPVDWLFIDGDHSYEGVKKDYENYSPLLSSDGYCIFHDIFGESGVSQLWKDIKIGKPVIEICHPKYNLGIGIIQNWTRNE